MFSENVYLSSGKLSFRGNIEEDPEELAERLRKTLYYGKPPTTDRPSLPLTGLAVEYFQEAAPKELGNLDTYFAASASRSACMSPSSMMAGMLYTRRLRKKNPSYLHQVSSSDLFLISMMMASKFMYDEGVDEEVFNDEWAEAGNMDVEDINQLEREFLSAIDWELFVKPEEFSEMLQLIEKRLAWQQGIDRGWFSYCDLWVLSQDPKLLTWSTLTTDLSKVVAVCSLAYLAGILTMVCSTILATSLSTGLVSLGSSMVLPSVDPVVSAPSLTTVEESPLTQDIDGSWMESILNIGATSSADSDNQELTTPNRSLATEAEHVKQVQPRNSLNSLLPPLLALVSLKDSFVDFVIAIRDRNTNSHFTNKNLESSFDQICSDGPCQQGTWASCWNISDYSDMSSDCIGSQFYDSYLLHNKHFETQPCDRLSKACHNCAARIKTACQMDRRPEKQASSNVRCCCSVKTEHSVMAGISWLHPAFSELSALGFMTGPGYPIFGTT